MKKRQQMEKEHITMTVIVLFKLWINQKRISVKNTTISTYMQKIESNILPYIGSYELDSLDGAILTDYILSLRSRGGLSDKTISDIVMILNNALKFAYMQGYIKQMITLLSPRYDHPPITIFSQEEQKILMNYLLATQDNTHFLIMLALYNGLRIGELCGLKYTDITNGICSIKRTVQRIKNVEKSQNTSKTIVVVGTPKSKLSIRDIPLTDFLWEVYQNKYQKDNNEYIMTDSANLSEPRILESRYKKILACCGISYKNFHTLRHTFATTALRSGFDIKTLADIMGHSVKILTGTYLHTDMEEKAKNMKKLKMA